jgi:hypothetical protein
MMENDMAQIELQHVSHAFGRHAARLSARARDAIKWWAEHQAWPAIDEIRIDDTGCCKKTQPPRQSLLRF